MVNIHPSNLLTWDEMQWNKCYLGNMEVSVYKKKKKTVQGGSQSRCPRTLLTFTSSFPSYQNICRNVFLLYVPENVSINNCL